MKVTLKKAFSILDGRLATEIGDVYEMLNYIFDEDFMTHQLPTAMNRLKELNPNWFSGMVDVLNDVDKILNKQKKDIAAMCGADVKDISLISKEEHDKNTADKDDDEYEYDEYEYDDEP